MWLYRNAWWGVMLFRVGGVYAPSNAAFTTDVFTLPATGDGVGHMWLNMDNRPHQGKSGLGGDMPSSYIMIAILPATPAPGTSPRLAIAGYEAERCVMPTISQQGYPMGWKREFLDLFL